MTDKVKDSKKKKNSVSNNTNNNSKTSLLWLLLIIIIVPYLCGYIISIQNLEYMMETIFNSSSSSSSTTTKKTDVIKNNNINIDDTTERTLQDEHNTGITSNVDDKTTTTTTMKNDEELIEECYQQFFSYNNNVTEFFTNLSIHLHRNGQSEPCSIINTYDNNTIIITDTVRDVLTEIVKEKHTCPDMKEKYQFESFLTRLFFQITMNNNECIALEDDIDTLTNIGFYGYCDMGVNKTPILTDHQKLVQIPNNNINMKRKLLPCHFHNQYGQRIISLQKFIDLNAITTTTNNNTQQQECEIDPTTNEQTCTNQQEASIKILHIYAVPAGRVFIHTPSYVGQIIQLPHVRGGNPNQPVYLEVLSIQPAVFDLHNFFTKDESSDLVYRATTIEQRESHKIKRSSTGASGYNINKRRTSESGFDTDGETAVKLKKRCFDVLGFDEYIESHADGLQILRYNLTTAYIPHMDWIDGNSNLEHNYESGETGGNRFATILLYMTDLDINDGGETVFVEAWPTNLPENERIDIDTALAQLRASDQHGILQEGSWEEIMVAKCRSRLAIHPNSARAVLFYSQLPNGKPDPLSLHGGCPVLRGTKYAANLWVWNTPRDGYPGNPKNPKYKKKDEKEKKPDGLIVATFRNEGTDPSLRDAELFFRNERNEDSFWSKLGQYDPSTSINTYKTHRWVVKVNGEDKKVFTIDEKTPPTVEFTI